MLGARGRLLTARELPLFLTDRLGRLWGAGGPRVAVNTRWLRFGGPWSVKLTSGHQDTPRGWSQARAESGCFTANV